MHASSLLPAKVLCVEPKSLFNDNLLGRETGDAGGVGHLPIPSILIITLDIYKYNETTNTWHTWWVGVTYI
jgi:hypothetical protein